MPEIKELEKPQVAPETKNSVDEAASRNVPQEESSEERPNRHSRTVSRINLAQTDFHQSLIANASKIRSIAMLDDLHRSLTRGLWVSKVAQQSTHDFAKLGTGLHNDLFAPSLLSQFKNPFVEVGLTPLAVATWSKNGFCIASIWADAVCIVAFLNSLDK